MIIHKFHNTNTFAVSSSHADSIPANMVQLVVIVNPDEARAIEEIADPVCCCGSLRSEHTVSDNHGFVSLTDYMRDAK